MNPKMIPRPASPNEAGLFYAQTPEEDAALGCIGHVRMDFGPSGTRFWHTWHPRGPEEWSTPEFKAELGEVMDSLRENVLQGLSAMRSYCREHGGEISGGWSQNYGYIVETERYRYCLRCNPMPGDYQAYLTCYDKQAQEMGERETQADEFPGGWHKGDACFLITNKKKKYALEHTVESFDGTYFGVRGHTGLFHRVSPKRMFHTREAAVASLDAGMPGAAPGGCQACLPCDDKQVQEISQEVRAEPPQSHLEMGGEMFGI